MSQKTPISLMNELAKGNNLNPEYRVVEETGPAHKKTFKVELTLGDIGKWESTANNIKEAKHKAAEIGLENCGLCLPEKKLQKAVNLTPTVELNGLAMKLGKATQYRDLPPKTLPTQQQGMGAYMGYQNMGYGSQIGYGMLPQHRHNQYNMNGYQRGPPRILRVSLTVGDQEFIGEGRDKQKARHDAALKAMKVLRKELQEKLASIDGKESDENGEEKGEKKEIKPDTAQVIEDTKESEEKSEISQVYEIANRMKLMVDFQDVENAGPAHMKNFRIRATVGEMQTEGEGKRKKDAKKEAAVKMLAELKKLPQPAPLLEKKKPGQMQYPRRGLYNVKKMKHRSDIDPTLNAISILGQILQRRHEPAPVYSMVEERGHSMNKDFLLKVTVGSHEATGSGPSKKDAKKNAAEAMLQALGFRPTEAEKAQANKTNAAADGSDANTCNSPPTILGRQLKPGLLPMVPEIAKQLGCNTVMAPIAQTKEGVPKPAPLAPALVGGLNRAPGAPVNNTKPISGFQQLLNLSEVHGFRVQYTDYPKDNQGTPEFLSVVNVSCVPPLTCYGSGVTIEAAREEAACNALKPLIHLTIERDGVEGDKGNPILTKKDLPPEMTEIKQE